MKKINIVFLMGLFLMIIGCTNNDKSPGNVEENISELETKILDLKQMIEQQQETIDDHEELILLKESQMKELGKDHSLLQEKTSMMDINLQILRDLVYQTTNNRTAILNDSEIKGDKLELEITFAEFIPDEEAPNGFRLEESEEGETIISITKNVPIYWLNREGDLFPTRIEWEEVVRQRGFIQLFEINGEVVFIYENYIP